MENKKYEEIFSELERIVDEIENPNIALDQVSAEVKKAKSLVAYCRALLREQEEEIRKMEDSFQKEVIE